jgi:xylulokinase
MYLGIDLGTSGLKLLLIDGEQRTVVSHSIPLDISRPHPQWSEQDPLAWWQAVKLGMSALVQSNPNEIAALRGIGLSGQMHGAVLLDANGEILRPAILWNDTRSGNACRTLSDRVPDLGRITGNAAMPGFTAPKLIWVAEHEPDIFVRTAMVLLPKDYLRYRLTGEYVSDMSDAAGTLWLDVHERTWSDAMLAACGLSRAQMPRLIEGSEASGMLRTDHCRTWGISQAVVVAGGAGDNAASAVGMGIIAPGDAFISLGTSGVVFAATDAYRPNPEQGVHTFCHALPKQWHQMGVMLSAASCLSWAVHVLHASSENELLAEIEAEFPEPHADAPIFLPYLSGERTPYNNPDARGVWFGMTHETTRATLGYAVLEGVAFGLLDSYRALQEAGTTIQSAALVGGGSRSRYWATLLSSIIGFSLRLDRSAEVGAALGAARLGLLAAEPQRDRAEVCTMSPGVETICPIVEQHPLLMRRYARFRELYDKVRDIF